MKSMPSATTRSAIVSASSRRSPPGVSSSNDIRMPTMKSGPAASRTARITRSGKRIRSSRLPPYSSSRWLVSGDQNASSKWV